MIQASEKFCSRCGSMTLRTWSELDEDQQMFIQRLPGCVEFTDEERKKHRFCTRCWFEISHRNEQLSC